MAVTLTIAGTDRSRLVVAGSVRMLNQLTRQVDQASFDIDKYGSRTFAPSVGQEVVIQNGSTKLFAGRIVQVDEQYDKLDLVRYRIQCVDYTRDLDHQLVVETYEDQTIDAIIADIKSRYLPSTITTTNVDAPVTVKYIAFNYEYPSDCLKQLAELVNYDWYVDYDKDIHFFAKEENAAPFELSDTGGKYIYESLSLKKDITPVRNTVYVRGGEYKGDTFTVERTGDGVHQLWGTEYKFDDIRVVTTGQEKSVGLDNIDNATNYDCLYNFTEKFIRFRADKIPTSGTLIQIIGRPWPPVLVKVATRQASTPSARSRATASTSTRSSTGASGPRREPGNAPWPNSWPTAPRPSRANSRPTPTACAPACGSASTPICAASTPTTSSTR